MTTSERFWSKVIKGGTHDCWFYTSNQKSSEPYFKISGVENKKTTVSRFAYQDYFHTHLTNEIVQHSCSNPKCCNPMHLFVSLTNLKPKATKHHNPLTKPQIRKIRKSFSTDRDLAHQYGVNQSTISRIRNNLLHASSS